MEVFAYVPALSAVRVQSCVHGVEVVFGCFFFLGSARVRAVKTARIRNWVFILALQSLDATEMGVFWRKEE